ncbi:hypothetical protein F4779DRAFT_301478 [Xylariaceae sp. FL0662B]|nr:hypothetical protein F4779DRAFT_301478 [Xylariaceae sp. FL0662B]
MSRRHVKFETPSPPRGSRHSREPVYDSGVGSLSSDQASKGGRPDRRFTDEDYGDQLYSIPALQEALGQANKKVEYYQKKCDDLDVELSKAHKNYRDVDKLWRSECERTHELVEEDRRKAQHIRLQEEQIERLKDTIDTVTAERDSFELKYFDLSTSRDDTTIRGGSGGQDTKDRMKKRIEHKDEASGSNSSQRRGRRLSTANPGARSSSKKPYIEKLPEPSSSRHSSHYMTSPLDTASMSHMEPASYQIPRSSQPVSSSPYGATTDVLTGDYVPYPLPERGRRRG